MVRTCSKATLFISKGRSIVLHVRFVFLVTIYTFANLICSPFTYAQTGLSIVATVNDDIVTELDLQQRISLVLLSSRLENTAQVRHDIAPQVLRLLIDDRLKLQEARRNNITVSDRELQSQLENIAGQNNLTIKQFSEVLAQNGIYIQSLAENFRAEIAWSKLISMKLRSSITIGQSDIERSYENLQKNAGKTQYHLYEIFLIADNPKQLDEVRQSAELLSRQARTGANFLLLAKDFSQAASAANSGEVGWIFADQLDENLRKVLVTLKAGEASQPIRTGYGYYIIFVSEQRLAPGLNPNDMGLSLARLYLPFSSKMTASERDTIVAKAKKIASQANNCDQFVRLAEETNTEIPSALPKLALSDLPANFQNALKGLNNEEKTQPIVTNEGVIILMICQTFTALQYQKEKIAQQLTLERLEQSARSYLRDLRRFAVINYRR